MASPKLVAVFAVKPPTAKQEFEELHQLLGTAVVAEVLSKRPESVSRLKKRASFTRPLERLIDDVWSVVFVARSRACWPEDQVRAFLLLRQPQLDFRPAAELIRAGQTEAVLEAIIATHPHADHVRLAVAAPAEVGDSESPAAPDADVVPVTGPSRAASRRRRRAVADPVARAAAQRRLAERGLHGLDRELLIAAGHEAWGGGPDTA